MQTIYGNLFTPQTYKPYIEIPDVICITTNGDIRANGDGIMGAGCAGEAKRLWPKIEEMLGHWLRNLGNVPGPLIPKGETPYNVVSFPTKHGPRKIKSREELIWTEAKKRKPGQIAPGWAFKADLNLIINSARTMVVLAETYEWEKIVIPRPGVGMGGLRWEEVRGELEGILDDRFHIITFDRRNKLA